MKKIVSALMMTLVVAIGCTTSKTAAQLREAKTVTYEYSAITRGSNLNSVVTKNTITVKEMTLATEKPTRVTSLSMKDWDALIAATGNIDLEKLETLEVPSKKHQFDGALAANLKITIDGTTYQSATFDHGNPPAAIKEVTEKIVALSAFGKDRK